MLKLSGIIPPLVTPLKSHDQLDGDSVDRLVQHVIAGGVNGLFVLGTTGEGPSLTYQIRYEMVERCCEATAGRLPVLVGVTDTCLAESIHLAEHTHKCGASAVVAAPPFYFTADQPAMVRWFRELADASPLPVLLYNMPSCVNVHIDVDTVVELSSHDNIIGVKDSSGDMGVFRQLCDRFAANPDFVVFMGPEEMLPQAVAAGADGGVCGGGNLLPSLYVQLYQASVAQDNGEIRRLQNLVDDVVTRVYRDSTGAMNYLPALKHALSCCGLCSDLTAPPLHSVSSSHRDQIDAQLGDVLLAAGSTLNLVKA